MLLMTRLKYRGGRLMCEIAACLALALVLTPGLLGQDGHVDISFNVAGVLPRQTSANGIVQSPTKSGAFLATLGWRFSAKHTVELNYARGNDSQIYKTPNIFRIQSNVTELSGAYVFSPLQTERFKPFVFAGLGALIFNPINTFVNTVQVAVPSTRQNELAILYGGGVDCAIFSSLRGFRKSSIAPHLALRLQYRGLSYKAPNFKNPDLFTGTRGHLAEAAIGLAIKF
jgi:hypothetical protein